MGTASPWYEIVAESRRQTLEIAVVVATVAGAVTAAIGGIVAALGSLTGWWVFAGGLTTLGLAVVAGRSIDVAEKLPWWTIPTEHIDRRSEWTRLKVLGVLLQLTAVLAGVALVIALFVRLDILALGAVPFHSILRAAAVMAVALVGVAAATHLQSLRTPLKDRPRSAFEPLLVGSALVGSVLLAMVGAVMADHELVLSGVVLLRPADAPFLMLASAAVGAAELMTARTIPSLYTLMTDERSYFRGYTYMSERKRIVFPAMVAMAFLFFVVLLTFVFGVGVAGLVEDVTSNALLIGAIVFAAAALLTSLGFSYMLHQGEDRTELFKVPTSREARIGMAVLWGSTAGAAALFVVTFLLWSGTPVLGLPTDLWLETLSVAFMVQLGPYGFYVAHRRRRIRRMEDRFPDFLRDVASSRRAGLTLDKAVRIAAKGDYGDLTPEIKKMADQLDLNISFQEALRRFGQRVQTPLVERSVSLILQASRSGGNVTEVLMTAAQDGREIKELEDKRRTSMSLYTAIVYITFFVFLAVAAILYATFVPEIVAAQERVIEAGATSFAGLSFGNLAVSDFRTFYYLAALVQGLGNGMIAGLVESGEPESGLRHAFVMVAITFVTFVVLVA